MGSSPRDCLEPRGAEPGQFDEFSATLSKRAGLPYAKPHSFRDTLVRLGQRICRPLRNGRFGAKIWGMRARRRHSSAMAKCRRIATLKSCGRFAKPVLILCRRIGHGGPEGVCSKLRGDKCRLGRLYVPASQVEARQSGSCLPPSVLQAPGGSQPQLTLAIEGSRPPTSRTPSAHPGSSLRR